MRRLRRLGGAFAAAVVAWLTLLALVGWLGDGCVRERAEERLANSMRAKVAIGGADVGLVTGSLTLRDVRVERVEQGVLRVTIDRVDVDLRPLGLALVQRDLGAVEVEGVDVELSALGALDTHGAREPVTFESMDLKNAHVAIEATSLLPGLARVELTIERAIAGPTTMRTPLSWLFALRELTARLDLPGGITVRCTYGNGVLQLAGGLFGDTPLQLPFVIPVLEPAREVEQLGEIGRDLGRRLVEQVGVRWLQERARKSLDVIP